ncbi:hypothetical protein [Pseudanabaena sp. FACHB-2040]|uniref:hypothetical protein n=1 Tax=Pseudanabaena sp. FACHB-2040 TaxID=2692859 RepID=UPI001684335B|nr:hypothetical protein [Pseudanabaena sp. FACHB-2040]MBD2259315.1 hypothetical protein [Pseudanabaena sp. FACHB-2040]
MTLKILERTPQRLIIQREQLSSFDLVWLAVCVNFLVTLCFTKMQERLGHTEPVALFVAVSAGWLLIHCLLAESRQKQQGEYWFAVAFGAIPYLGVLLLSLAAIGLFGYEFRFPPKISLTLDQNENRLTIKSQFLLWFPTTQYPLDEIIGATQGTESIYTGSMSVSVVITLNLIHRRRQDGKLSHKNTGLCGSVEEIQNAVNLINQFSSRYGGNL